MESMMAQYEDPGLALDEDLREIAKLAEKMTDAWAVAPKKKTEIREIKNDLEKRSSSARKLGTVLRGARRDTKDEKQIPEYLKMTDAGDLRAACAVYERDLVASTLLVRNLKKGFAFLEEQNAELKAEVRDLKELKNVIAKMQVEQDNLKHALEIARKERLNSERQKYRAEQQMEGLQERLRSLDEELARVHADGLVPGADDGTTAGSKAAAYEAERKRQMDLLQEKVAEQGAELRARATTIEELRVEMQQLFYSFHKPARTHHVE